VTRSEPAAKPAATATERAAAAVAQRAAAAVAERAAAAVAERAAAAVAERPAPTAAERPAPTAAERPAPTAAERAAAAVAERAAAAVAERAAAAVAAERASAAAAEREAMAATAHPAVPGKTSPVRSGPAWTAPRARGESPWDSPGDGDGIDAGRDGASEPVPSGFARPLTPPPGLKRRVATPVPLRLDSPDLRTPSDPEIETYLEMEADLPPERGDDPDLETELALSLVLGGDRDDDHESVSITIEEEGRRVIETTTETDAHTLTVTVTEPVGDPADYQRAITAEDGTEVSGSISIPEDTPPPIVGRRARRQSDGWDE
jgi:hypothetical protein